MVDKMIKQRQNRGKHISFYVLEVGTTDEIKRMKIALNEVAADLDYISTKTKGKGNTGALLLAIAQGEVIVTRKPRKRGRPPKE